MNIKQGDRVTIDGKTAKVETWWNQGKHRVFKLSDGRTVFDLPGMLANDDATIESDKFVSNEDIKEELKSDHLEEDNRRGADWNLRFGKEEK